MQTLLDGSSYDILYSRIKWMQKGTWPWWVAFRGRERQCFVDIVIDKNKTIEYVAVGKWRDWLKTVNLLPRQTKTSRRFLGAMPVFPCSPFHFLCHHFLEISFVTVFDFILWVGIFTILSPSHTNYGNGHWFASAFGSSYTNIKRETCENVCNSFLFKFKREFT